MDVKTCRRCRRFFNYISGPSICPACRDELEKKFLQVKDYIREHENAGVLEVSEQNDVGVPQIQQWIREERLQFSENSDYALACEHCGAPIYTGRFCEDCKKKLIGGLNASDDTEDKSPKKKKVVNAMRFIKS